MIVKLKRKNKPHETEYKKYKHIVGNNGEDIQEYSSSKTFQQSFKN